MTKDRVNERIGSRIRKYRKRIGMTQTELAKAVGYTSSGMMSQVENGLVGVEISKLQKIAKVLGVHPGALIAFEEFDDQALAALMKFEHLLVAKPKPKYLDAILALMKDEENG